MIDSHTRQWLGLLESSPSFVIRVDEKTNQGTVKSPPMVPKNDGEYWVFGSTTLKTGQELPSVFRVQTNSGGTLLSAFWCIDGDWHDFQDPKAYKKLNTNRDDATPFDWTYSVKLEDDIYHS